MSTPKCTFVETFINNSKKLSGSNGLKNIIVYKFNFFVYILFQNMWKCRYLETSAKNNVNITELFEELLKLEKHRVLSLQPLEDTEKKKRFKEKCLLM